MAERLSGSAHGRLKLKNEVGHVPGRIAGVLIIEIYYEEL